MTVALLLLGWLLGMALALEHRVAHAPGAAHAGPHAWGGPHEGDDPGCRLADQAGLGDTLLAVPWVLGDPAPARSPWAAAPARPAAAAPRLGYHARAPPRG